MEVIQARNRPAHHGFYRVAGRFLFVQSFDLQLKLLIERFFAGWQLAPLATSEHPPDIHLTFTCSPLPSIPQGLKHFEVAEGGQCFTDGADLYLALSKSLVQLRNTSPTVVNVWFEELPRPEDPAPARATSFGVCAALRRFGIFDLHSAGVIQLETDTGVLIIGPSGSGKSTLALRLAMDGWPYLSDDEVLLELVDGVVESRGFRSFFAVNSATASAAGVQPSGGIFKTCFEPDALVRSSRRERALPGLLLFTRLSGKPTTRINKLSQAEAMGRLIRACPWASYDTSIAGANLDVLSRLARQASAYDLFAGRDLLEPGCASDLLSSL